MSAPVSTLIDWLHDAGLAAQVTGPTTPVVSTLTFDSRQVRPGGLFAALPGSRVDGHDFIEQAVSQSPAALLVERVPEAVTVTQETALITVENSARALAVIAARFFGPLPQRLQAVTGTNGKTSVAHFVRLLNGEDSAVSIGTLGMMPSGLFDMPSLTSPDQIALAQGLAAAAASGRTIAVVEASSHGLDQGRLDGLLFDQAGFTNLSRDHLDYHPTMEAYWHAKRRLFAQRLRPGGQAVIDERAPQTDELDALGVPLFRLGALDSATADLGFQAEPQASGLAFSFRLDGQHYDLDLPLFGTFQAENIAVALGLAHLGGVDRLAERLAALPAAQLGVPGRMMPVVHHPKPPHGPVLVDYAHTPDALSTVLRAARPHCTGRLIVVFGAGGDRDPGKRPLMGAAAASSADHIIITDDNPRSEDPALIRAAIQQAAPEAETISDRAAAIAAGLARMQPDDLLLIAGKGHETGQIVGDTTLPFDDIEHVRRASRNHWGETA